MQEREKIFLENNIIFYKEKSVGLILIVYWLIGNLIYKTLFMLIWSVNLVLEIE